MTYKIYYNSKIKISANKCVYHKVLFWDHYITVHILLTRSIKIKSLVYTRYDKKITENIVDGAKNHAKED